MPEPLLASLWWDGANAVVIDAKFITSVVVGVVGTAATVLRNLGEISQGRSKRAVEKLETARVAELLDLLAKLPSGDSFAACKRELELQLAYSISKLDALRAKVSRMEQAPNHDLRVVQRLFLLFPPCGQASWIIHALAYAFMAGGPLAVLLLILFGIGDAGTVGDVMVLVVFGSLAFRAWALAERKWAMESVKQAGEAASAPGIESGPLTTVFVLRKPTGWKMLVAQVCLWVCMFCAVESLEDIFLAGIDASKATTNNDQTPAATKNGLDKAKAAQDDAKDGLLLFLASLLGAVMCRAWASAESQHGLTSANIAFPKTVFPIPNPATMKDRVFIAGYVSAMAVAIASVIGWSRVFKDPIDRVEFTLVWLVASVACNRLLNFRANPAKTPIGEKSAQLSESAAA